VKSVLQLSHAEMALIHHTFRQVIWRKMVELWYLRQCKTRCTGKKVGMLIFSKQ